MRSHNPAGTVDEVGQLITPLTVNSDYDDGQRPAIVVFGTPGCG